MEIINTKVNRQLAGMGMKNHSRNEIIIVVFCGTVVGLLFYNADGGSLLHLVVKALLFLGCLTFVIQYIGPRFNKLIKKWRSTTETTEDTADPLKERFLYLRQQAQLNNIQDEHSHKAASYKERILVPREEAQKKKKEEEHRRFMGPAWRGKGDRLGGEENDSNLASAGTSKNAAHIRKLPEQVTKPVPQPEKKPQKVKKVIVLPDEPVEGASDSITVVLRTPLGGLCKRRFSSSHTVQTVLDYMTTLGHSQSIYTLATTYPRQLLSNCSQQSLGDLGFHGRATLNIEEKDISS